MKYKLIFYLTAIILLIPINIILAQENKIKPNEPSLEDLLDMRISTAAKYEQSVRDAPSSVTVITSEDIANYGWQTLKDALLSQPGFFGRDDRNYTYIGTRGFERPSSYSNKILLLLDGHTINDNIYYSPIFGNDFCFDMFNIDRIEIIRGPGSSLYGTSAMLAVINIITKNGEKINGVHSSVKYGSWKNTQGTLTLGKSLECGLNMNLSAKVGYIGGQDLYYKEFDDSITNFGWARGLDWERFMGSFGSFHYSGFTLNGFYSHRDKGIPTGSFDINFNDNSAKTTDERGYVELKYDNKLSSRLNIMIRAYYDYYNYHGAYPYDSIEYDGNTGKSVGSEIQAVWDPFLNNRFTAGLEFKNNFRADNRVWYSESTISNLNSPYNVFSVYGQDQWQIFENFNLVLGLRHDYYTNAGNSTTPRISLAYNVLKNAVLKGIYGQAFRTPNIYELFYKDYQSQKDNPKLIPEKINTYELVWQQQIHRGLTGTISFYYYQMKNIIDQILDPVDNLLQYQNRNQVNSTGVEFTLNYNYSNILSAYTNFSYNLTKDAITGEKLSNSPSYLINGGISTTIFDNFIFSSELIYESERFTEYRTHTDPFLLVNVFLSYNPKNINKILGINNLLNFTFKVNNIFNTNYSYPGGQEHKQHSIRQDGRNFLFELSLSI